MPKDSNSKAVEAPVTEAPKPKVSASVAPPEAVVIKNAPAEEAVVTEFDGDGLVNKSTFDLSSSDHFGRMTAAIREKHAYLTAQGKFKEARAEAKKMLGILLKAL